MAAATAPRSAIWILLASAMPAMVSAAPTARAIVDSAFRVGRWDGRAFATDDGSFSHCTAVSSQPKSTLLSFSATADGALYLGFMRPSWKLLVGEITRVSVAVDGKPWVRPDALSVSSNTMRIGPLDAEQLGALHAGREVRLKAGNEYVVASLEDGRRAMEGVAQCAARFRPVRQEHAPISSQYETISLKINGGTFVVPVLINHQITLNFTIDSGAADVSIPSDVFSTLVRTGTLNDSDYLGTRVYQLADGTRTRARRVRIRSLKLGSLELANVEASVAPPEGALLLGQSFLSRLGTWSIDNRRQVLVINGPGESKPELAAVQTPAQAAPAERSGAIASADPWYQCMKRQGWRDGANEECDRASAGQGAQISAEPPPRPSPAAISSPAADAWYQCMKQHQWREDARDLCPRESSR